MHKATPLLQWSPTLRTSLESDHLRYCGYFDWLRMHWHMFVYNLNILKCGNPVFCKADRFSSPISTWTVQNSLNNANACMPFMHDCLAPLIDPTTGLYTSTGTHSTGLSHQHTIRESSRTRLHSSQQHEYTLSCLPEIHQKPPKYGHLYIPNIQQCPLWCAFLEGSHCITFISCARKMSLH